MKAIIKPSLSGRGAPFQRGQVFDVADIEPCGFAGAVPVMALLHMTGPSAPPISNHPSAMVWRLHEPEPIPGRACRGVLYHTAPPSHRLERGGKAPAVVSSFLAHPRGSQTIWPSMPVLAPALARWVRDHWPRARILPRIADLVPGIYPGHSVIDTARMDEKGCNHGVCVLSSS